MAEKLKDDFSLGSEDKTYTPTEEELSLGAEDQSTSVEDVRKKEVGPVKAVEESQENTWSFPSVKQAVKQGVKDINPEGDTSKFSGGGIAGVIDEGLNALGHATNIPKNIATRQAAMFDTAANWLGEKTGLYEPTFDSAERIARSQSIPEYRPREEGTVEDLKRIAVESLIPGGLAYKGVKGAKFVAENPGLVAKTAENLAKLLIVEGAAISGVSPGEDAVFMEVIGRDPEGNYSEELAKENINLLAEAAVLGKLGELGIRTVAGLKNFVSDYGVSPFRRFVDGEALEEAVVKDTADPLIIQRGDENLAEEAGHYRDLANKARAGKEQRIRVQEGPVDDELVFKRDTMSSIASQTQDKGLQTRAKAANRSLQRAQDTNELSLRRSQPVEETDRFLSEVDEGYGGAAGRKQALEKVQEGLETNVDTKLNKVFDTDEALKNADVEIVDLMKKDPDLGPKLSQLSDTVDGVGLRRLNELRGSEAINQIQDVGRKLTIKKNELYQAIPEAAEVNFPEVSSKYMALKEKLMELPKEFQPPKKLLSRIEGKDGEILVSFKDWNETVNFEEWNSYVNTLKRNNQWDTVRDLNEFKKYINEDQLEFLEQSGEAFTAQRAKEALNFYRNDFAPYLRDNQTIQDIVEYGRDYKFAPKTNVVESRSVLNKSLIDDNSMEFNDSMIEYLQKHGPEGSKPVTDIAIGRMAQQAQDMINMSPDGILDESNFKTLYKEYQKYALVLDKADPAQRARLDTFFEGLKGKKKSKAALQEELKLAQKDYSASVRQLQKSGFFRERMGETIRLSDPDEVFTKVFRMEDSLGEIKRLSQEHPEAVSGLKSSFFTKLKKDILNFEGDKPVFDKTKNDEFQKMMTIGKELFGKDSPIIEATEMTHEFLQKMHAKGPYEDILDTRSNTKDVRGLMEFAITQVFGPLNRWGARLRSAGGRIVTSADTSKQVEQILDRIYSDPEEFARILDRVADKTAKKSSPLTKQDKRYINKWIATSLTYGLDEENGLQDRETIENILNQEIE